MVQDILGQDYIVHFQWVSAKGWHILFCGSHASFVSEGMVWPAQVDLTIVVVLVRQGHFKAAIKYF
jgi:hypothetical protein